MASGTGPVGARTHPRRRVRTHSPSAKEHAMATSERKLAANRANARRSTGPRTAAGKRKVSRNAIVHGLTARSCLLHGDDVDQYSRFARRIVDDLHPDGAMQVQLTEEVINYSWRLRRVPGAEQLLFEKHHTYYKPDPDESDDADGLDVWCDEDDDEYGDEKDDVEIDDNGAVI